MRRLLAAALLLLTASVAEAQSYPYQQFSAHISSATTTHLVAAVTGKKVMLVSLSCWVQANGVQTTLTFQDTSAGTVNLLGTSMTPILNPGQSFPWPWRGTSTGTFVPLVTTASGTGIDLVTGQAGPVECYGEYLQQ